MKVINNRGGSQNDLYRLFSLLKKIQYLSISTYLISQIHLLKNCKYFVSNVYKDVIRWRTQGNTGSRL